MVKSWVAILNCSHDFQHEKSFPLTSFDDRLMYNRHTHYGVEIIEVKNRDEKRQLRVAFNSVFRKIFGYRWSESVTALQGFLGKPTWEELVERRRSSFFSRIANHHMAKALSLRWLTRRYVDSNSLSGASTTLKTHLCLFFLSFYLLNICWFRFKHQSNIWFWSFIYSWIMMPPFIVVLAIKSIVLLHIMCEYKQIKKIHYLPISSTVQGKFNTQA